jgi:hypothetical protein
MNDATLLKQNDWMMPSPTKQPPEWREGYVTASAGDMRRAKAREKEKKNDNAVFEVPRHGATKFMGGRRNSLPWF